MKLVFFFFFSGAENLHASFPYMIEPSPCVFNGFRIMKVSARDKSCKVDLSHHHRLKRPMIM